MFPYAGYYSYVNYLNAQQQAEELSNANNSNTVMINDKYAKFKKYESYPICHDEERNEGPGMNGGQRAEGFRLDTSYSYKSSNATPSNKQLLIMFDKDINADNFKIAFPKHIIVMTDEQKAILEEQAKQYEIDRTNREEENDKLRKLREEKTATQNAIRDVNLGIIKECIKKYYDDDKIVQSVIDYLTTQKQNGGFIKRKKTKRQKTKTKTKR